MKCKENNHNFLQAEKPFEDLKGYLNVRVYCSKCGLTKLLEWTR